MLNLMLIQIIHYANIWKKFSLNFEDIINYLKENNVKVLDIFTEDGDLEDVFVQLTKK